MPDCRVQGRAASLRSQEGPLTRFALLANSLGGQLLRPAPQALLGNRTAQFDHIFPGTYFDLGPGEDEIPTETQRHAVLRTSFHWDNLPEPLQVVSKRAALPLEVHDWRTVPPDEQPARLDRFLQEDRQLLNSGNALSASVSTPFVDVLYHNLLGRNETAQELNVWNNALQDGTEIELSRHRMRDGVQGALAALEAEGCDAILLLCTGTFEGLACHKAWLIEPDHIISGMVAGLIERRQLGVIVPIASQIGSESGKWRALHRHPIFAAVSPYSDTQGAVLDVGKELKTQGADAILLDCIGFTERHRQALSPLDLPVILSNAVAAKAVGELLGG